MVTHGQSLRRLSKITSPMVMTLVSTMRRHQLRTRPTPHHRHHKSAWRYHTGAPKHHNRLSAQIPMEYTVHHTALVRQPIARIQVGSRELRHQEVRPLIRATILVTHRMLVSMTGAGATAVHIGNSGVLDVNCLACSFYLQIYTNSIYCRFSVYHAKFSW